MIWFYRNLPVTCETTGVKLELQPWNIGLDWWLSVGICATLKDMATRNMQEVGELIRERRESLNIRQDDFPDVSSATIGKAERGVALPARGLTVAALCRGLRWRPDALDLLAEGADPPTVELESQPDPDTPAPMMLAALNRKLSEATPDELARLEAYLDGLMSNRDK